MGVSRVRRWAKGVGVLVSRAYNNYRLDLWDLTPPISASTGEACEQAFISFPSSGAVSLWVGRPQGRASISIHSQPPLVNSQGLRGWPLDMLAPHAESGPYRKPTLLF